MKERIQVLAAQQQINFADVNHKEARTSSDSYYLDSVDSIMQKFGGVKEIQDIYNDKKIADWSSRKICRANKNG